MTDWLKLAAKPADLTRQQWRAEQRASEKASRPKRKVRVGKRARFFDANKEIATFYTAALDLLMTGPRAQRPTWRATVKTMRRIAASPRVKPPGMPIPVPLFMLTARHMRPSWRAQ